MTQPEPLTDQQLDDIDTRTDATRSGPWTLSDDLEGDGYPGHLWVVRTPDAGPDEPDDQAVVISIGDRALGEFIAHARTDVPALLAEIRRLKGQRKYLLDQLAKKDAKSGDADRAVREFLADEPAPGAEELTDAPNPVQLRWGLDDVQYGDDDSVIVMLSGPDGEPYWLELDAERAPVLRRDLAGPDGEQPGPDTLPAWLYRRFMPDGIGWDNLDDGDRAYWEHQAAAVRRAVERGGFKTSAPTAP